jgi:hypothetical protein
MPGSGFFRVLPILGVSLYACAMSFFFAWVGLSSPPGNAAVPTSLGFGAVTLLGLAVAGALGAQERRIQELERRLRECSSSVPASPHAAASSSAS